MEKKWEALREAFLQNPSSLNDEELAFLHRRAAEEISRLEKVEKQAKVFVLRRLEEGKIYSKNLLTFKNNGYTAPTLTWRIIADTDWDITDNVAFDCLVLKYSELEKVDRNLHSIIVNSPEYLTRRTPKQQSVQWAPLKENVKVRS